MSDTKNILRTPESYLDEVAPENNFEIWEKVRTDIDCCNVTANTIDDIVTEAMRHMCEDAFKAQKEICAESAEAELVVFKLLNGKKNAPYAVVNKSSIINAPTPFNNNL